MNDETKSSYSVSIPTLVGMVRKVACLDGTEMDEEQYVVYEVLCCLFLLDLIKEANDLFTGSHLRKC